MELDPLMLLATLLVLLLGAVAGKSGWWRKDNTDHPMRTWRLRLSATPIDTTSFLSNGYSEFITGFTTGEVTASGFFDPTRSITIDDSVDMSLGIGGGYSILITVTILDITYSTAVDRAGEVEVMGRTNGVFTPTFAQGA